MIFRIINAIRNETILEKLKRRWVWLVRRYIRKNRRIIQTERFYKNGIGENQRINYPLGEDSVVFDVGGYDGMFSERIYSQYRPCIYIFEPQKKYFIQCAERFRHHSGVNVFNFGLSSVDRRTFISSDEKGASTYKANMEGDEEQIELKNVVSYLEQEKIKFIDLMKLNIEGEEYELLESLIASGKISQIKFLQVQFHSFVPNADERRRQIRSMLDKTHEEMWNYEFIWESWRLLEGNV